MVSFNQPKRSIGRLSAPAPRLRYSAQPRPAKARQLSKAIRSFEAEALGIESLQIVAPGNLNDDLSGEQAVYGIERPRHSKELITQLIDFIKAL